MAIRGLGRTPANTAGAMVPNTAASSGWALQGRPMLGGDGARGFDNTINAVNKYGGKPIAEGGKSPSMQASDKAEAAWKEAMGLLQKQGPYTPEVVNQLTNRRADQTAAAEAVNAEEIRNQAAARGMDPTQAIRGLQQGRQAQNVAFSGDIASQAAVQNFAAETPGRMAAAQANLNRQFGGATEPAVSSGGGTAFPAPRSSGGGTAFPAPRSSGGYNPGAVHQQAAQVRQPVGATAAANTKAATPVKPKPMDLTESQYMTPFNQRPNQSVIERTPTQQKTTLSNLNAPGVKVYKPGAFGVPRQNLQTFGLE